MNSWSLLVCALAPWVWEKGGQHWGGQPGTRDPQSCCFCCSWEVWAHLVTATAARDCCGSSNQCPIKPHSPTPQLQQPAGPRTDKWGCCDHFATPRSCWFCPLPQSAFPAPLAASAAPEFGPSGTALRGNNRCRNSRWKGSILEAFSQKDKRHRCLH